MKLYKLKNYKVSKQFLKVGPKLLNDLIKVEEILLNWKHYNKAYNILDEVKKLKFVTINNLEFAKKAVDGEET